MDGPTYPETLRTKPCRCGYWAFGVALLLNAMAFQMFLIYGGLHDVHLSRYLRVPDIDTTDSHALARAEQSVRNIDSVLTSAHTFSQVYALLAAAASIATILLRPRILGFVALVISAFALNASTVNF